MDSTTYAIVEKIISQNDRIIDAIIDASDPKAFDVLASLLDNNGLILDALFPQVQFVETMAEDEPPMMQ